MHAQGEFVVVASAVVQFGLNRIRAAERFDTTFRAVRYDILNVVARTLGAHALRIEEAQDRVFTRGLLAHLLKSPLAVSLNVLRERGAQGNVVLALE